jgi:glycosyltransferase involved in cell wall biosynthesis
VRILQVSSARNLGGGERHLADLANALHARGHEVYAALPPRSPLREELRALPPQNIFALRLRNALDVKSALALARLIREHRIEIVHAHLARDYPLAALATMRNRRTKLVITRHVLFPLNRLHALTLSHAARVIAVSRAVERALLKRKIFPANKITVIHNGIDFRRLDASLQNFDRETFRREMRIPLDALLIGTIGDLKKQKGHEDFLRAAALIAREEPSAHFVIVGADTTREGEYQASLERLVKELGLTDRVTFAGWMKETAPLLAALDVYVSASHTESFGLSIVEAMAAGLAVVATATEGAQEIIDRQDVGVLVPIGDAEELAQAVRNLLKDANERTRIGKLARASARTRFSLERMVDETEQVYLEAQNSELRTQDSGPRMKNLLF